MKKTWLPVLVALGLALAPFTSAVASPEDDVKKMQDFFKKKFPKVPFDDFSNGIYALDADLRSQWEQIMEFPPYEIALEEGEKLFKKPFKNGKTFSSCFPKGGIGIAQDYPKFDAKRGEVLTLPLLVNECLKANGEDPYPYEKGKIASVVSYMASTSRGKRINIVVPNDPKAQAIYEKGKQFYYARRGQLNLACSHCHLQNAGNHIRTNLLSTAIGQTAPFPVYRSKWGEMGTLHRRYSGCNEQVRAKNYNEQSDEYRSLEYFHTNLSNGLPLTAPGTRE